jgi:hypothetical protein
MIVSTAKVDITPRLATNPYLAGYGVDTPRKASGDHPYPPLSARCIVLWDNDSPKAIVVADVLAFPRSMHQTIRQRVLTLKSQWASSDFILQATHTHNGPVLKDKPEPFISYNLTDLHLVESYSSWLEDQIVALVQTALAAPQTSCTLDYQVADEGFAYNRECLSYTETSVPILVARDPNGSPVAILFSYGCHPVSADKQTQYDGDFPSGACELIDTATGAFSMFLQGPAGDQDPAGARGLELRNKLSRQLSETVLAAIQQSGRALSGPIETNADEVNLPLDITDTPSNLNAVQKYFETRLNHQYGYYRRHAQVMIRQIKDGAFEKIVPLPLQVWKFHGNPTLRMAFTGGELVSGYGVYFRDRYGGAEGLLIGGYANEVPAYIPSNELLPPLWSNGSYGGGWCPDYPGIAGGSQTIYGYLGHFLAGTEGLESKLIEALTSLLNKK